MRKSSDKRNVAVMMAEQKAKKIKRFAWWREKTVAQALITRIHALLFLVIREMILNRLYIACLNYGWAYQKSHSLIAHILQLTLCAHSAKIKLEYVHYVRFYFSLFIDHYLHSRKYKHIHTQNICHLIILQQILFGRAN